jgi:hypothetical protein
MPERKPSLAETLSRVSTTAEKVTVKVSNAIVKLLSDQLYASPIKAIEELVVNSYDADAKECRLFVPAPSQYKEEDYGFVIQFDNGAGMNPMGLHQLWHIGLSNKRGRNLGAARKQIGKFGIGKLATCTIANKLTYITKTSAGIFSVTIDYRDLEKGPADEVKRIDLPMQKIGNWSEFATDAWFQRCCRAASITDGAFRQKNWTLAVLEELKDKIGEIRLGRLQWVLRTAMPLQADFRVFLNGNEVISSKEDYKKVVEFKLKELGAERLRSLKEETRQPWKVSGDALTCKMFPSGIRGFVVVYEHPLPGKSDDLVRSNGFFIRVLGRLVNEEDPLFGLKPLSHTTFNRFRASIAADDLDEDITAPREGIAISERFRVFEKVLLVIFNEARTRYEEWEREQDRKEKNKREDEREFVSPRLVEHPVADVLSSPDGAAEGGEADDRWFYLDVSAGANVASLVKRLYTETRDRYQYAYANRGSNGRVVSFNPDTATFTLNESHPFVANYSDDGQARHLLHDMVTAEALLEIYLREAGVPAKRVGDVLERRDVLLRALAMDHPYSLRHIAAQLRDAASDERNLEIAIVAAARALGFVATHISGGGDMDGIARFMDYPGGEKKIALEAKSSADVPSLGAIDFAGLREHVDKLGAEGCLLVAPVYPGESRGNKSSAANRAIQQRISCWTVELLARFVESAENRHFNAQTLLDIVLKSFTPTDVNAEVERLLTEPSYHRIDLNSAIIRTLGQLESALPDAPRSLDMIAGRISADSHFQGVKQAEIDQALRSLAEASAGSLVYRDKTLTLLASIEEILRRVGSLTAEHKPSRRKGTFRDS